MQLLYPLIKQYHSLIKRSANRWWSEHAWILFYYKLDIARKANINNKLVNKSVLVWIDWYIDTFAQSWVPNTHTRTCTHTHKQKYRPWNFQPNHAKLVQITSIFDKCQHTLVLYLYLEMSYIFLYKYSFKKCHLVPYWSLQIKVLGVLFNNKLIMIVLFEFYIELAKKLTVKLTRNRRY
jgi:hypothetical protein